MHSVLHRAIQYCKMYIYSHFQNMSSYKFFKNRNVIQRLKDYMETRDTHVKSTLEITALYYKSLTCIEPQKIHKIKACGCKRQFSFSFLV